MEEHVIGYVKHLEDFLRAYFVTPEVIERIYKYLANEENWEYLVDEDGAVSIEDIDWVIEWALRMEFEEVEVDYPDFLYDEIYKQLDKRHIRRLEQEIKEWVRESEGLSRNSWAYNGVSPKDFL